jgi:hypothetical protein
MIELMNKVSVKSILLKQSFDVKSENCLKNHLNRINRQTHNKYIEFKMNRLGRLLFCIFY